MDLLRKFIDIVLHLDRHLDQIVAQFGPWIYVILFLIVFCETGLVITPFLPGDSLLFAVGAVAARPDGLSLTLILILLTVAAILGDTVNYWIGYFTGPKVFKGESRYLNKKYLDRTHAFYERYGGKTIIIARFVPIVRTFAPFVAGIGRMSYFKFMSYNIFGGLFWVFLMSLAGYFFGNIQVVKDNFTLVVLVIIFLSILPGIIEYARERNRIKAMKEKGVI
jgi:membrane-associated protein